LGLALDEPSDTDEVFEQATFKVIINKELHDQLGGVRIDFGGNRWQGAGFRINAINSGGSGGSCSC
jgi:iron-sulfur cluster assembly protein